MEQYFLDQLIDLEVRLISSAGYFPDHQGWRSSRKFEEDLKSKTAELLFSPGSPSQGSKSFSIFTQRTFDNTTTIIEFQYGTRQGFYDFERTGIRMTMLNKPPIEVALSPEEGLPNALELFRTKGNTNILKQPTMNVKDRGKGKGKNM